ncbi:MAG: RIP metalloprotease RseP [Hyphomicrobiales bacterium]|nr:RIP metalloprotease RseP [Hyphomicrobiales bacterium]
MPEMIAMIGDILLTYALPTLVVILLVVFVHELGHFQVGRWCGVQIEAFSIGFGRELFGYNDKYGTRWKLSAIPLGGYVKFVGDENAASLPKAPQPAGSDRDESLFHNASVWKRMATVAAGPIANFILASAVFAIIFATLGRPLTAPRVDTLMPGGAAEAAGFLPGDLIVEIDGKAIESFSQIQQIVTLAAGNTLTIIVERGGERIALTPTPERREMDDGLGGTHRVGVLGITRNMEEGDLVYKRFGPLQAVVEGVKETGHIIERTMTYVGRLFAGRETADQLSGPIRVAQVSGLIASSGGVPALLHLSAILSVSIGLINLFPVPMLDGGHLVFYAIEAIRGRPVSRRAQEIGFRIGLALVIMLFVFVTFNDIVRLAGI